IPRLRRYASAIVPEIGCDIANSRRADSDDPIWAGGCRLQRLDGGSGRGRLRKDRASSSMQTLQPAVQGDEVEEITVLAGSSVGPFAGSTLPVVGPYEANEQAAARRVRNIADDPVATPAIALREVMAAHRLGITRETARQIGGLRRHFAHAAALSPVLAASGISFRLSCARHSELSAAACSSPLSNMVVPSKSEANQ